MATKIYTRTGDSGQTGLIGGDRVYKSDPRIEACGSLDELNAYLGLVADLLPEVPLSVQLLRRAQERLFTAGSLLAVDPSRSLKMPLPQLYPADVTLLETAIDAMEADLPPLRQFILPGGQTTVSQIHIARCTCRKAERAVVALDQQAPGVPLLVLQYLNRLSDYLFVLARRTALRLQAPEIPWVPEIN